MRQATLFPEIDAASSSGRRTIGEQKDIRYYATHARSALNAPEATGMAFWSINPYVGCAFGCVYCYARYAHRYAVERAAASAAPDDPIRDDASTLPPWLAFERRIFVKRNAPELLRRTLRQGSERHLALVRGAVLVIGTATDAYQPAERHFRITRGVLEVLAEHPGLSVVIITKSPLITRDIDVLARIARHSALTVHLSLITLDRELARRLEPRSPTPESRLRALVRLRAAGIDVGINIMPVLPGITDNPTDLQALVRRVAMAGATHVNACALRLRRTARERYLPVIGQEFPHLTERYRAAYADGHQVSERYRLGLRQFLQRVCREAGIRYGTPDEGGERAGSAWTQETGVAGPAAEWAQLELGV